MMHRTLISMLCRFGWLCSCWSLSFLNYWCFAFSSLASVLFCFCLSVLCFESCGSDRYIRALYTNVLNPFSAKDVLIDFTLSNARRFYSSMGSPLALKGLRSWSMLRCPSVGNKDVEIEKVRSIVHAKLYLSNHGQPK